MEKEINDHLQSSLRNVHFILSSHLSGSLLPINVSFIQQLCYSLADSLSPSFEETSNKIISTENKLAQMLKLPEECQKQLSKLQVKKRNLLNRYGSRGPYRSYSLEEKNYVVYLHRSGKTFASISKELDIPQKNVVRWCRESESRELNKRTGDREMQANLSHWITLHQNENLTQGQIQQKALQLTRNPLFKASRGWLKNFLRRYSYLFEVQESL